MPLKRDESLLEALLDSWDRNNLILVNLLRAVPEGGLECRVMDGSPTVAAMFTHIHFVRLVFITEDAPDLAAQFAGNLPSKEWREERDPGRIAQALMQSSKAVREVVRNRVETNRPMELHYDHPILFLQHMVWHEGYHHGQIKLALKAAGHGIPDDDAGPVTWDIWMEKTNDSGSDA